jgi:L-asparaginase / beta-aspartyl-peptidase
LNYPTRRAVVNAPLEKTSNEVEVSYFSRPAREPYFSRPARESLFSVDLRSQNLKTNAAGLGKLANRKTVVHRLVLAALLACALPASAQKQRIAIAIHGGAGVIERASLTPAKEAAIRADLERAVRAGYARLSAGASSLDGVSAALVVLEDSPYFNAGKGAVYTANGTHELDAAIMDGARRRAGAVAGLRRVKNPILLARAVMERSNHVMLSGAGAEEFARTVNITLVAPNYFDTPERLAQLKHAQQLEKVKGLVSNAQLPPKAYFGTVGAVALDQNGNLAAATSTGGMTNKRFGRIGDTPIIGAGTYADRRCAVSATGHGEFFMRSVVAYDICARVAYRGSTVKQAADVVILDELKALGGEGGVIAMDESGAIATPFNSAGMYRASIDTDGHVRVEIF